LPWQADRTAASVVGSAPNHGDEHERAPELLVLPQVGEVAAPLGVRADELQASRYIIGFSVASEPRQISPNTAVETDPSSSTSFGL
jgi:hypothetical protein